MTSAIRINRIDTLEPRFLLASFASLNAAGVLSVVGTSQSNVINVAYSGSNVKVTRDGSNLYFDKTKVKKVWAEAYGGNDKITIGVALPSTLIGDAGNDTLIGNVKDDEIHGGSGDDRLIGGDGSNVLDHGSGKDVLDYSAMSAGEFDLTDLGMSHPGTGVDIVGNSAATVLLTPGNDTFTWGGQNQELDSKLTVDGGAGNDAFHVEGFPYRGYIARLNGGAGNDTFWFDVEAGGVSYIDCGSGNDVITDNAAIRSPTSCDGGPGHDTYNMEFEWDFDGGAEVNVPPGIEEFSTDTEQYLIIHGNDLDNKITGSSANVTLYGNGGNDKLIANVDANGFSDDPGHGLIDGGSGNDTLIGTAATAFKGGSGNDTADFSSRTEQPHHLPRQPRQRRRRRRESQRHGRRRNHPRRIRQRQAHRQPLRQQPPRRQRQRHPLGRRRQRHPHRRRWSRHALRTGRQRHDLRQGWPHRYNRRRQRLRHRPARQFGER